MYDQYELKIHVCTFNTLQVCIRNQPTRVYVSYRVTKNGGHPNDFNYRLIKLRETIVTIYIYVSGDVSADAPRLMCLNLLLVLITGTNNVSNNILLEYIMINSLFESFVRLLSDPTLRAQHGHDVVILLTLLVNYRKGERTNPYIVQLSILADELALNGYGQMISSSLIEFGRQYTKNMSEIQPSSWFSSLSNIVGNMFVSDEGCDREQIRANNALLLALYEAVHLNRNFITTLAHTQAESSAPPSPSNTLNSNQPVPDLSIPPPNIDVNQYPTNLLVAVFQYW